MFRVSFVAAELELQLNKQMCGEETDLEKKYYTSFTDKKSP